MSSVAHANVPDFVFRTSGELWTILSCTDCASLYLRERPDTASIGAYYKTYYTHQRSEAGPSISGIQLSSSILQRMANSWRNHRYGTQRDSLGDLGILMMLMMPPLRAWIDAESRHIPPRSARPATFRVLDVGCGDGRFVRFAQEAGCQSIGMEVDPKAVERAQQLGLDIHYGDAARALEMFGPSSFDWITLSHVIEHVHQPRQTLKILHDLLRVDGRLWIETPNPRSLGHRVFGDRWRDLDPPRHLCLLSRNAIIEAAFQSGLSLVAEHLRPFVPFETFPFSAAARNTGTSPDTKASWRVRLLSLACEVGSKFDSDGREWLTLIFARSGINTNRLTDTDDDRDSRP